MTDVRHDQPVNDKALIVIPTYNERDNVIPLSEKLMQSYDSVEILFIDDNSPDGTGDILDDLSSQEPRIHVLHREGKQGLGTAYITGFKWALERDYEYIFEMDADFSHSPAYIGDFLRVIRHSDLVLGSRYTQGVSVINWSLFRLLISKFATLYVRIITGMPASDATGGFKCFRRQVLETLNLDEIQSNGYSFQIEMTYYAWYAGFKIREIPIIFYERADGISKMNKAIVREAIWVVWRLWLTHIFKKKPSRAPFFNPEDAAEVTEHEID